jgi:hypothetical protein
MCIVTEPIVGPIFPEGHEWFGNQFVLFTDTQEFLDRVVSAATRQGLNLHANLVKYYDESGYSGETGRFRKRSCFAYQREYRITIESGLDGPRRFEIGDLTDITSEVIPRSLALPNQHARDDERSCLNAMLRGRYITVSHEVRSRD